MGKAKENFEKLKDKEVRIYDTALKIAEMIEDMSKEDQQRILALVDKEMKITPPPTYSQWDR